MTFIDEVTVTLTSGNGGDGAATFHREKHVPRGGPNGANGGRGGDVVLVADRHLRTLYDFKLRGDFKAGDGSNAQANKAGKDGDSLEIRVPVGTMVTDATFSEPIADLSAEGARFVVCRGGRGGLGNLHYTNSVRQSPTFAQRGEPGEELLITLELKLLADAGLVGLPNAGKSTLLGQISRAKPKVGAYPFTTITPNLGVAQVGHKSFVVADLPGLIEGASEGLGLGHQFLRHTERTKVLVHVVDGFPIDGTDPWENYQLVEQELAKYSASLAARPRLIALNKLDLRSMGDPDALLAQFQQAGHPIFMISGATGEGIEPLLFRVLEVIEEAEAAEASQVVITPLPKAAREPETWEVKRENTYWRVSGRKVERMVAMTALDNNEGVRHLHKRLDRMGVIASLQETGVKEGDTVVVGDYVFEFTEW